MLQIIPVESIETNLIIYLQIYLAYVFEITKHKNTEFFIKQKKTITFEILKKETHISSGICGRGLPPQRSQVDRLTTKVEWDAFPYGKRKRDFRCKEVR